MLKKTFIFLTTVSEAPPGKWGTIYKYTELSGGDLYHGKLRCVDVVETTAISLWARIGHRASPPLLLTHDNFFQALMCQKHELRCYKKKNYCRNICFDRLYGGTPKPV